MSTSVNAKQVKMNIMTKAQYEVATKSPTELYMVTDALTSEVENINTACTFYAWRQDFDATKILYTTVPYDTSVTGFKVYDSSFKEVINDSLDENEFYQNQMWYYDEDGTGFVCTRAQANDVVFTPVKQWIGTREQYDAIVTKDNGTYYHIIGEQETYIGTIPVNKEVTTTISASSTDDQVPSAKAVYDLLSAIESALSSI